MFASTSTSSSQLDLRTLRAVRVLRPLKLVSGVPSQSPHRTSLLSVCQRARLTYLSLRLLGDGLRRRLRRRVTARNR